MTEMARREFLHAGAMLSVASLSGLPRLWRWEKPDLVLRRAIVFDGTGAPGVEADLHIGHGDTVGACSDDPNPPRSVDEHVFSHVESQTTVASTLTFQTRLDRDTWSSDITYTLQAVPGEVAGNGVDDDGDGVVDEQQLVRMQDGETLVISEDVTAFTCTRNAGEYLITIDLTIARGGSRRGEVLTRNRQSVVRLRNVAE